MVERLTCDFSELTQQGNHKSDNEDDAEIRGAAFRFRLFAMLYDALVVLGIWIFTIVLLVTVTGREILGAWVQSLLFLEMFAFFTFFWIHRGQTIGMLAWRLRIQADRPFNLRGALLRFIGALLSFATLGLGYFWIWFDGRNRSFSDLLSHSIVIRYERESASGTTPNQQDTHAPNNDDGN